MNQAVRTLPPWRCIYAIALFAVADWAAAQSCDEAEAVATVTSVEGTVEILRASDSSWQPAILNDSICLGDTIRIGALSRAEVFIEEGWIERFDQNSSMRFGESADEERSILDLLYGVVLFFSRDFRNLEVVTPYANAAVEGTEFIVRVEDEQTEVIVLQGTVVTANGMGELSLEPGSAAVASASSAPQLRTVVRPRDAAQWSLYYPPILSAVDGQYDGLPVDVARRLSSATELASGGDRVSALELLNGMAEADRGAPFYLLRAAFLMSVGRVTEASLDIERSLAEDPTAGRAYALRAIIRIVQNDRDLALADAERAVELNPNLAATRIALSYAQQAELELEAALESMLRAVEDEPRHAIAWARLSELWLTLGYRDRAREAAQTAVELEPNLSRAQNVLGFAALSEFRTELAAAAFERAISLDSGDPLPRLGLGLAKINAGELAAGRRDIELAVGLDPGNALLRAYLGKAYFEERRRPLDSEQFATAKEIDPNDPTAYFYDGIRLQTENRPIEAVENLQQASALNDNRAVFRSSLQLDADRAARAASLARAFQDLGFVQQSASAATRALADDPANASAHRLVSDAYLGTRRQEIARVSELLQAQLLQDININPIQPSISETNLNIGAAGGPARMGVNEFTPLFERNQTRLNASLGYGNLDSREGEAVVSAVHDRWSLSGGMFRFDTDGFRPNNQIDHDIADLYGQVAVTPKLNLQAELRHRETSFGDLELNFDPAHFDYIETRSLDQDMRRMGLRYSRAPGADLLVSFIHSDRNELRDGDPFDARADDSGQQAEAQYLLRRDRYNVAVGIADAEVDRTLAFSADQFMTTFFSRSRIEHPRAYAYANLASSDTVRWTIGLSYDEYSEDELRIEEVNPKLGVQWSPTSNLQLRAASFQTVKPALVSNLTVEQTQVAGFNQLFDDVNATRARVRGIGLDWSLKPSFLAGTEATWREVELPVFLNATSVMQYQDEETRRVYFNWMPTSRIAVTGELAYDRFEAEAGLLTISGRVPLDLTSRRIPLAFRYFHPLGFFTSVTATSVHQSVARSATSQLADGVEDFVNIDLSIGYRLPKRRGILSLQVENLRGREFRYQDDSFREFGDEPSTGPFIPARRVLLRFSVGI